MTKLADGVWGWAGAEKVNAACAAVSRGRGPAAAPKAQPCNEITDKLFLGTKACAEDVHELTSRDIVVTIAVGEGLQLDEAEVIRATFLLANEDTDSLLPHFPKAFKRIRQGLEDGGVLIFCKTGQASTALTAGFLMAEKGMSFEDAKSLIAEKRVGAVELNRNLSRQLSTWAKWPEFPGLPDWM
eukprot:Tamp_17660.p2 GENE.Tamp_17660~~Tamp_17660.p2  ORF type:complete len:202 (-),score=43.05 Tamp_17660:772-1326(-)